MRALKKGSRVYKYGMQLAIPIGAAGEVVMLKFTGAFDHRKLRRMVRTSLKAEGSPSFTTEEIDWMIKTYGVKMKPATMEQLLALAEMESPSDETH